MQAVLTVKLDSILNSKVAPASIGFLSPTVVPVPLLITELSHIL